MCSRWPEPAATRHADRSGGRFALPPREQAIGFPPWQPPIVADQIEVAARAAPNGTFRYWVRSVLTNLPALGGFGGGEESEPPRVVVRSASGEEVTLLRTGTFREARRAVERFDTERRELGDREFCGRYGLPLRLIGD